MRAVFVDGENLNWMRQPLGIGKLNYHGLYDLLAGGKIGGTGNHLISKPVFTINVDGEKKIGKMLRNIGFDVIPFDQRGEDDQILKDRINSLNPEVVNEILVVSADQDFVESLRRHASAGVKVYWLATVNEGREGRSMVSSVISESTEFEFVELTKHKEQLMQEAWEDREPRPRVRERENSTPYVVPEMPEMPKFVKITLSTSAPHSEITNVLRDILKVIATHPSVKYTIEG